MKHVWPDGPERPGYGRGVLAGDSVLWPTRDKICTIFRPADRPAAEGRSTWLPRGAAGGNLLVADGRLLIATGSELIALRTTAGSRTAAES